MLLKTLTLFILTAWPPTDADILKALQQKETAVQMMARKGMAEILQILDAAKRANGDLKPRIHPAAFARLTQEVDLHMAYERALPEMSRLAEVSERGVRRRIESAMRSYTQIVMTRLGGLDGCAAVAHHLGIKPQ